MLVLDLIFILVSAASFFPLHQVKDFIFKKSRVIVSLMLFFPNRKAGSPRNPSKLTSRCLSSPDREEWASQAALVLGLHVDLQAGLLLRK